MRICEGIVKISVRELVEFVLRQGSIKTGIMSNNRAVLGTLAHKRIQESMEGNYEAEVKLVDEYTLEQIIYVVEGRADGIITDLVSVTIDEIKTTTASLELIDENFNYLHWAQAKCYAYFYAKQNHLEEIGVQLTYYHIETKGIKHLKRNFFYSELEMFYGELIKKYHRWIKFYMAWTQKRDDSLRELKFPFSSYRVGQRTLAGNVYKSIQKGERLYISAPTGIGKTISTLFPALKAMGEGYGAKIFYLTAKTVTRTVAEQAGERLYKKGAKVKMITLTAKEKICFLDKPQCSPEFCKWANGHYDRVDEAIYEIINETDLLTRDTIMYYAKKYEVCPFELTLDLAVWADVVVCDYNYIFDPNVALKRFLDNKDFVLLVDESHNLVDRAREMYSASLSKKHCLSTKKSLGKLYPPIGKELNKINDYLLGIRKDYVEVVGSYITQEAPKTLYMILRRFLSACDKKMQQLGISMLPKELVDFYFEVFRFIKIYELFDEHYVCYAEVAGHEVVLKMFCIDPSSAIASITKTCRSVVFFSATLLPIDYYKYMLGGTEDRAIAFPSPFNENYALRLVGRDVSTRYKNRTSSYQDIITYINEVTKAKIGNYMVFFPSYKYMMDVYRQLEHKEKNYELYVQESNMDEDAREQFLARFKEGTTITKVNFCVLGGVFSEGIDLTGNRLIGVIIVGVGLPQIGIERSLIQDYFNRQNKDGYHYAYTYPGMNKVLQAAGRLIRTETDQGIILFIDDRFSTTFYEHLFPLEYNKKKLINVKETYSVVRQFWEDRVKDDE